MGVSPMAVMRPIRAVLTMYAANGVVHYFVIPASGWIAK
jgi:hypothetical protein